MIDKSNLAKMKKDLKDPSYDICLAYNKILIKDHAHFFTKDDFFERLQELLKEKRNMSHYADYCRDLITQLQKLRDEITSDESYESQTDLFASNQTNSTFKLSDTEKRIQTEQIGIQITILEWFETYYKNLKNPTVYVLD